MYGDMEMIKQDYNYSYSAGVAALVPTEKISFMTKRRNRWQTVGLNFTSYNWVKPVEPILAPTILSTWSK